MSTHKKSNICQFFYSFKNLTYGAKNTPKKKNSMSILEKNDLIISHFFLNAKFCRFCMFKKKR